MNTSILSTIKSMLGYEDDSVRYDTDIINNINLAFMILYQIGVGSGTPYSITSSENLWSEFFEDNKRLESVKMYIYLKTKLGFDPPTSAFVLDAMERQLTQLDFYLHIDNDKELVVEVPDGL